MPDNNLLSAKAGSKVVIPFIGEEFYLLPGPPDDPSMGILMYFNKLAAFFDFPSTRLCMRSMDGSGYYIEKIYTPMVFVHEINGIKVDLFLHSRFLFDLVVMSKVIEEGKPDCKVPRKFNGNRPRYKRKHVVPASQR